MKQRKHQPPSRARYQSTHPTIAIHTDVETRNTLFALRERTGLSLGQLVKQSLGVLEKDLDGLLERGRQRGYDAGKKAGWTEGREAGYADGRTAGRSQAIKAHRISFTCSRCGNAVNIPAGSEAAAAASEALAERGWVHSECTKGPQEEEYTLVRRSR